MSTLKRLRNEISTVQERIRSLGNTNRTRWAKFSPGNTMTKEEFVKKLHFYGYSFPEQDIEEIWGIMAPENNEISMNNFTKLVQVDPFSFVPSNPVDNTSSIYSGPPLGAASPRVPSRQAEEHLPPLDENMDIKAPKGIGKVSSTSKSIFENLTEIILGCMDLDRKKRAEISLRSFTSICADAGVNSYNEEWKEFIHKFDPYATGLIPYYLVADTVCKDNDINALPPEDLPPLYENERNAPQPQQDLNSSSFNDPTPRRATPQYQGYDEPPQLPPEPVEKPPLRPPPDYDERYDAPPPPQSSYDNYPPHDDYDSPPPRPQSSAKYGQFEVGEEEPPINPAALAKIIATKVDECMGSPHNAFNKWRGIDSRLTPRALQEGLKKDASLNVALGDLQEVMAPFGGDLSEMGFSRLIESAKPPSEKKLTQDDQALQDIADQIQQTGWEKIFYRASSAQEIVRLLGEMGVAAAEPDIRRLTMKLGRTGVIDGIKRCRGEQD